jgi:molybdopterin biosynthesis enzyme
VLAELTEECGPLPFERIPVGNAVGGVLAEPLVVPRPVPAETLALRAGFAVASRDLVGVSAYAPLPVPQLSWVEAGDPLPEGCDAVLPPDGAVRTGPLLEIVAAVSPGENARRTGEDGVAGQTLAGAGRVLSPSAAAAALAAGIREAAIRRCECQIVTWEEPFDQVLTLAGIPGLQPVSETIVPSDAEWSWALGKATAPVVLAVTNRGLGPASERLHTVAQGLALRPGETTQVFRRGAQVVTVVPRRLEALFAVGHCLLAPLAAHLTGMAPEQASVRGRLTRKLTSTIGLTDMGLVRRVDDRLEPLALGALSLPALAQATGWFAIPPESEGLQEGEILEAYAL